MVKPSVPPFRLPPRKPDAHKGDFGRVGIVAGSRNMSGAAILCGRSGLRGGAGLVHLFVPQSAHALVAQGHPCYMVQPIAETPDGVLCVTGVSALVEALEPMDAIAIGPGCGLSPGLGAILDLILTQPGKVVVDADGLNQLAQMKWDWSRLRADLIMTPHPGEMKRLLVAMDLPVDLPREETARLVAQKTGGTVLLKGHGTIVTDGKQVYLNATGNPGMATGGCGDVLTGLIAAFWCQGLNAYEATCLGAWVHGRAGDIMVEKIGMVSLLATDLVDGVAEVLRDA